MSDPPIRPLMTPPATTPFMLLAPKEKEFGVDVSVNTGADVDDNTGADVDAVADVELTPVPMSILSSGSMILTLLSILASGSMTLMLMSMLTSMSGICRALGGSAIVTRKEGKFKKR